MAKEVKATGIKTWPEDDRPREKLLKKGAKVACAKFALTSKGSRIVY
ncbi:MAG: UPF0758 domain-containing protein [Candidatus Omnitrophota bacterium]